WSNDLVIRLGLPGAGVVVRSGAQLRAEVERLDGAGAVVKDPFGVAGRGSLTLTARGGLDAVVRHLDRQGGLGRRVELLVQLRYDVVAEVSSHAELGRDGRVHWLGWQVATTRADGYPGSAAATDALVERVQRPWRGA